MSGDSEFESYPIGTTPTVKEPVIMTSVSLCTAYELFNDKDKELVTFLVLRLLKP